MDGAAGNVIFRPHQSEDMPFLMDSWGSSYYKGVPHFKKLTSEEFHSYHRPIRERFFSKPNTCVIVACPDNDHWFILGWIAVESTPSGLILQYIYVRATAKREGMAKDLLARVLPSRPVFYTHLTDHAEEIIDSDRSKRFGQFFHIPHLI